MAEAGVTIVRLDPVGGMAGDMFIAAAISAWPELAAAVEAAVARLNIPGTPRIEWQAVQRAGIAATTFGLQGASAKPHAVAYPEFRQRLVAARLTEPAQTHALGILDLLADAESAVHGIPRALVHFHELGDWDTLVDVVASATIIAHLRGAQWRVGPLPLGSGSVRTAHGILPVPAPATAWLLRGLPVRDDGVAGERVTPTGAAIVRYLHDLGLASSGFEGSLRTIGTGAGTADPPGYPNVLRLLAFAAPTEIVQDRVVTLRFEVDDQSPEDLAIALDHIRDTPGVLDVSSWTAYTKKGRITFCVQVLGEPGERERLVERCLAETATLGVRWQETGRYILPRVVRDRQHGAVRGRVKRTRRPGGGITAKAEADDLARPDLDYAGRRRIRGELETTDEDGGNDEQ